MNDYRRSTGDAFEDGLTAAADALIERGDDHVVECVVAALRALSRLSPDPATVAATLMLPLSDGPDEFAAATITDLPDDTVELGHQLKTLTHFGRTYLPDDNARAEGLRRLLLALIADVRVVLIALAWQLARLQQARNLEPMERQELARETQLIHAPLANRLGVWQLKWELEDLAFHYTDPRTYANIRELVAERRADREAFISGFMEQLGDVTRSAGIAGEISGRPKHIYSIWRKMQRKGLDFHELFDVRAVRVLVDTIAECYTVLGLVHTHWQPVPGEFDDYIANPKANLYQSLHTAVTGSGNRVVEVQIRTHDMHRHAELGVAAHWRYKEGGPRDPAQEKRINSMRKLLEGIDPDDSDADLLESFQQGVSEDRVYVLTPRGEVRDLAAGATPLDFAYLIHTDVGHRCRGARINGRIVPLTTPLKNGDRIEILTAKEPKPSRDWLSPQLGYIRTARARGKVRHWFKQAHFDDNLAAGRQAVDNEFRRLDLDTGELDRLLGTFNFQRTDDLLVAVGSGELTARQLAGALERLHESEAPPPSTLPLKTRPPSTGEADDVRIEGVGNLLYQIARCCQPVPGDLIGGYITRGRGVSIHRQDCRQFIHLGNQHPERIIEVNWSDQARGRYSARIQIEAGDRRELIRDIGNLLATENVNVTAMNARSADQADRIAIELSVQVEDFDQLAGLLGRLQTIPGIISARRLRD